MVKLVLLPGMDGTGELFAPFLAALGADDAVRVVRYPTGLPGGYRELEVIVREALPASGPYVLLGESFSGPIAVSVAASQPPGLVGLVLCCSFVRNPRPLFNGMHTLVGRLPAIAPPIGLLSKLLLGKFSTVALRTAFAKAMAQVPPATMLARLQAVLSVDVSAELKSINVPMLCLSASEDLVVPRAATGVIQRLRPGCRLVDIAAPHFLLQAAPTEAAIAVREFMMKVR